MVFLEDKPLNWYQWLEVRNPVKTWSEFKRQVLNRFHEVLMALSQKGTVSEYREKFEFMSAPLSEASDEMLMGAFRNRLKEDIRAELRIMKFGSLQELMDLAHSVEERNTVVERSTEDFLAKHLKTAVATKWNMAKPNGVGLRVGQTRPTPLLITQAPLRIREQTQRQRQMKNRARLALFL